MLLKLKFAPMKKALLLIAAPVLLIACNKEAEIISPDEQELVLDNNVSSIPAGYSVPSCVTIVETPILAGQTTNVGSVTVWNDAANLYVSYQMTGDYKVRRTHMYAGACDAVPVNNAGNPRIGQYPYQADHGTAGVQIYTYTIPRSSLPSGCICVSAHAEVIGPNNFSETGWGQGEQINDGGSWAMKFNYCQADCNDDGADR
jgi:hypothetical protein